MKTKCYHIVRRFEPIGGMESYVWKLTHHLQDLGVDVTVVCEKASRDPRVPCVQLGVAPERRRWKAMRSFRTAVLEYFVKIKVGNNVIIHSHERSFVHNVTTIHGPLMRETGLLFLLKYWFSRRVRFWSRAEQSEIVGDKVKAVLPVSDLWGGKIVDLYPGARIFSSAPPGLDSAHGLPFSGVEGQIKLVFVGREWRRKGLPFAIQVCSELVKTGISCSMDVYGASGLEKEDLPTFVSYKGDVPRVPFGSYDLLIHPAKSEPYGMVVPEALIAGCRVLVSDQVGAKMLNHSFLLVRRLDDGVKAWAKAAADLISSQGKSDFEFSTWSDLASYHVETVYPQVLSAS